MTSGSGRRGECSSAASDHARDGKHAAVEEGGDGEDGAQATVGSERREQQSEATGEETQAGESKDTDEERAKCRAQQVGQAQERVEDDGELAKKQLQVDAERSGSREQQAEGTKSPEEDAKQVR